MRVHALLFRFAFIRRGFILRLFALILRGLRLLRLLLRLLRGLRLLLRLLRGLFRGLRVLGLRLLRGLRVLGLRLLRGLRGLRVLILRIISEGCAPCLPELHTAGGLYGLRGALRGFYGCSPGDLIQKPGLECFLRGKYPLAALQVFIHGNRARPYVTPRGHQGKHILAHGPKIPGFLLHVFHRPATSALRLMKHERCAVISNTAVARLQNIACHALRGADDLPDRGQAAVFQGCGHGESVITVPPKAVNLHPQGLRPGVDCFLYLAGEVNRGLPQADDAFNPQDGLFPGHDKGTLELIIFLLHCFPLLFPGLHPLRGRGPLRR